MQGVERLFPTENIEKKVEIPSHKIGLDKAFVQDLIQRVSDLPGLDGEFDAKKELDLIWRRDKKDRAQAVFEFKDKIARQREAWAYCKVFLEEIITTDPNVSTTILLNVIREFSKKYGFSKSSEEKAKKIIEYYSELRKQTIKLRKKFPNDQDLLNHLTNGNFSPADFSEIKITSGIFGFEIYCPKKVMLKIDGFAGDPNDYPYLGMASVKAIRSEKLPIHFLIVRTDANLKQDIQRETLSHEREHLSHSLLYAYFNSRKKVQKKAMDLIEHPPSKFFLKRLIQKMSNEVPLGEKILNRYDLSQNVEEKDFLLNEFFVLSRKYSLDKAKSEIFAILKDGSLPLHKILDEIFLSKKFPAYQYNEGILHSSRAKSDVRWKELSQKILVEEYVSMLRMGIVAISRLLNSGYSVQETIALLTDASMPQWSKLTQRFLETPFALEKRNKFQEALLAENTRRFLESKRKRINRKVPRRGWGSLNIS